MPHPLPPDVNKPDQTVGAPRCEAESSGDCKPLKSPASASDLPFSDNFPKIGGFASPFYSPVENRRKTNFVTRIVPASSIRLFLGTRFKGLIAALEGGAVNRGLFVHRSSQSTHGNN